MQWQGAYYKHKVFCNNIVEVGPLTVNQIQMRAVRSYPIGGLKHLATAVNL